MRMRMDDDVKMALVMLVMGVLFLLIAGHFDRALPATFTWTPDDETAGVSRGFVVEESPLCQNPTEHDVGNSTIYVFDGIAPFYCFRVKAYNDAGQGEWSRRIIYFHDSVQIGRAIQ